MRFRESDEARIATPATRESREARIAPQRAILVRPPGSEKVQGFSPDLLGLAEKSQDLLGLSEGGNTVVGPLRGLSNTEAKLIRPRS
jgi:hypothetical protein